MPIGVKDAAKPANRVKAFFYFAWLCAPSADWAEDSCTSDTARTETRPAPRWSRNSSAHRPRPLRGRARHALSTAWAASCPGRTGRRATRPEIAYCSLISDNDVKSTPLPHIRRPQSLPGVAGRSQGHTGKNRHSAPERRPSCSCARAARPLRTRTSTGQSCTGGTTSGEPGEEAFEGTGGPQSCKSKP